MNFNSEVISSILNQHILRQLDGQGTSVLPLVRALPFNAFSIKLNLKKVSPERESILNWERSILKMNIFSILCVCVYNFDHCIKRKYLKFLFL